MGVYVLFRICQRAHSRFLPYRVSSVLLFSSVYSSLAPVAPDTTYIPVSIIPGVLFVCTCKCTGIVFADATAPYERRVPQCSDSRRRVYVCARATPSVGRAYIA